MPTVFRSRVDWWLLLLLLASIVATLLALIQVTVSRQPGGWWAVLLIALPLGVGLPVWLLLSTTYTLTGQELRIRSGPFRWRIPAAEITAITPTSNPLSSPALSLDRLRIDYGQGRSVMISPLDKPQFLEALEAMRRGS